MSRATLLWAALVLSACSGGQTRPAGPPPEYERPELPPWDSGTPPSDDDPFADIAAGGWVDENPDEAPAAEPDAAPSGEPDAAPIGPGDAGAPVLSPDGGVG